MSGPAGGAPEPGPAGLQPERTALAWRRLALALVAGGLIATHLLGEGRRLAGLATAGVAAVVAVVLLVVSHRDLAAGSDQAAGRTPVSELVLAAVAIVLLAAAGVLLAAR